MKALRTAVAIALVIGSNAVHAAPALADNETTHEQCREDKFVVYSLSGDTKIAHAVHFVGTTGVLRVSPLQSTAGGVVIQWDCNGPSHDVTHCGGETVAYDVIRSGQSQFRVDCYDATGLSAREVPNP